MSQNARHPQHSPSTRHNSSCVHTFSAVTMHTTQPTSLSTQIATRASRSNMCKHVPLLIILSRWPWYTSPQPTLFARMPLFSHWQPLITAFNPKPCNTGEQYCNVYFLWSLCPNKSQWQETKTYQIQFPSIIWIYHTYFCQMLQRVNPCHVCLHTAFNTNANHPPLKTIHVFSFCTESGLSMHLIYQLVHSYWLLPFGERQTKPPSKGVLTQASPFTG